MWKTPLSSTPWFAERSTGRRGFTLIEVLVVVAIIALLAAVLLPSLQRAREQSKLLSCQANCKQIGTLTETYRSEYDGYVPIMYNYYANGLTAHGAPPRACWLSVAFRAYDKATVNLKKQISTVTGQPFDPEGVVLAVDDTKVWPNDMREEYEHRIMPEYYSCPFKRSSGKGWVVTHDTSNFLFWEWGGQHENYLTWLWQDIVRNRRPPGTYKPWPFADTGLGGPRKELIPQYNILTWNRVFFDPGNANDAEFKTIKHRKWLPSEIRDEKITDLAAYARSRQSGTLADVTVIYCGQGEHIVLNTDPRVNRANVDSHRTGRGGGTNAIFGDSHVEWVWGLRIGWP